MSDISPRLNLPSKPVQTPVAKAETKPGPVINDFGQQAVTWYERDERDYPYRLTEPLTVNKPLSTDLLELGRSKPEVSNRYPERDNGMQAPPAYPKLKPGPERSLDKVEGGINKP